MEPIKFNNCTTGTPTESFLCMTLDGCVWNGCSWLVPERGVTLLLIQGLAYWWRCVVLAPPLCEFPYKLEQLQWQLRLLCELVWEVRCSACYQSATQRQYDRSTCSWRLALPWWPYTLQSNFRLFSERLRLITGRGVSFVVTVSFRYRIHNPSRTEKLIQ